MTDARIVYQISEDVPRLRCNCGHVAPPFDYRGFGGSIFVVCTGCAAEYWLDPSGVPRATWMGGAYGPGPVRRWIDEGEEPTTPPPGLEPWEIEER